MVKETTKCIICIGSNTEPAFHLAHARDWLEVQFPSIRFGKELETKPEGTDHAMPLFHNQCATFTTSLCLPSLINLLKEGEKQLGRKDTDKQLGTIHIDIDLLKYAEMVIKPHDINKHYVVSCMASLDL